MDEKVKILKELDKHFGDAADFLDGDNIKAEGFNINPPMA